MLVLSRKENESIRVVVPPSDQPTTVVVTVAKLAGQKVRLGFSAPRAVEIVRSEVATRQEQ